MARTADPKPLREVFIDPVSDDEDYHVCVVKYNTGNLSAFLLLH